MAFGDATTASIEFHRERNGINTNYKGVSRRARLIIAENKYALALLEGGLGAPDVRANWTRHVDKMWRARRDPETAARESLLHALVFAEQNYSVPHVGWERPRASYQVFLGKDPTGRVHAFTTSLPFEDEAAKRAVDAVARFDPETAAKIPVHGLAAAIPIFAARHQNVGRRGKATTIDAELCELVQAMGLAPVTREAMRRQRVNFEQRINQRPVERARVEHAEALRRERIAHKIRSGGDADRNRR